LPPSPCILSNIAFPATSEREKVRFHQINSKTGNRIGYRKVEEGTGQQCLRSRSRWSCEAEKGQ
jgi:non-homologous end joining protein Ku